MFTTRCERAHSAAIELSWGENLKAIWGGILATLSPSIGVNRGQRGAGSVSGPQSLFVPGWTWNTEPTWDPVFSSRSKLPWAACTSEWEGFYRAHGALLWSPQWSIFQVLEVGQRTNGLYSGLQRHDPWNRWITSIWDMPDVSPFSSARAGHFYSLTDQMYILQSSLPPPSPSIPTGPLYFCLTSLWQILPSGASSSKTSQYDTISGRRGGSLS